MYVCISCRKPEKDALICHICQAAWCLSCTGVVLTVLDDSFEGAETTPFQCSFCITLEHPNECLPREVAQSLIEPEESPSQVCLQGSRALGFMGMDHSNDFYLENFESESVIHDMYSGLEQFYGMGSEVEEASGFATCSYQDLQQFNTPSLTEYDTSLEEFEDAQSLHITTAKELEEARQTMGLDEYPYTLQIPASNIVPNLETASTSQSRQENSPTTFLSKGSLKYSLPALQESTSLQSKPTDTSSVPSNGSSEPSNTSSESSKTSSETNNTSSGPNDSSSGPSNTSSESSNASSPPRRPHISRPRRRGSEPGMVVVVDTRSESQSQLNVDMLKIDTIIHRDSYTISSTEMLSTDSAADAKREQEVNITSEWVEQQVQNIFAILRDVHVASSRNAVPNQENDPPNDQDAAEESLENVAEEIELIEPEE